MQLGRGVYLTVTPSWVVADGIRALPSPVGTRVVPSPRESSVGGRTSTPNASFRIDMSSAGGGWVGPLAGPASPSPGTSTTNAATRPGTRQDLRTLTV